MKKYLIGGITISTEIEFPELLASSFEVDTNVEYGSVPHIEGELLSQRKFLSVYDSGEVVFKVPELANYYIQGSSKVIIEILDEARRSDAEKYVITLVFGILSYKKGYFPLHGGGVIHKGKAILFTGLSGAGKSTTMVGLHKQGFKAIGDDIANLFIKDGKVYVHPCFPRFKLWEESMELLDQFNSGEYKLRTDLNKFFVPAEAFAEEPIEVKRIYLLKNSVQPDNFRFYEFYGVEKFRKLKRNSYKPFMVSRFGLMNDHFEMLMQITDKIKLFGFYRKKDKDQFDKMIESLINHFDQ